MLSLAFFRREDRKLDGGWVNLNVQSENAENPSAGLNRPSCFQRIARKFNPPLEVKVDHRKEMSHLPSPVSLPTTLKPIVLSKASTDKPLPPTPVFNAASESNSKAVAPAAVKVRRILAPLIMRELHDLFSGAPHFIARPGASWDHNGAPYPTVAFPWSSKPSMETLRDHTTVNDPAWACVSASLLAAPKRINAEISTEKQKNMNYDLLHMYQERPNMLSTQGLERGTIGYCAALEMAIADQGMPWNLNSQDNMSFHRANFLKNNDLLRPITDLTLVNKLIEHSEAYHNSFQKEKAPDYSNSELFAQILLPTARSSDFDNPCSIDVQICCLLRVLSVPVVWADFSDVEWRLRLGQILWISSSDSDYRTLASPYRIFAKGEFDSQRYWLLLQVLLGCELLLRFDVLTEDSEQKHVSKLIENFGHESTQSIIWTLILARVWLQNICVEKPRNKDLSNEKRQFDKCNASIETKDFEISSPELFNCLRLSGRHQARQISGLLNFAEAIKWPNVEKIRAKLTNINPESFTFYISTGYMGRKDSSSNYSQENDTLKYKNNVNQRVWSWQTFSYINGLILPGRNLSSLIVSTLLEVDTNAPSKLGNQINSHGGFVHLRKSFWSSSCIIGKVLAASKGASECMGWISSEILPTEIYRGWIEIKTKKHNREGSKARIWHKNSINRQSDVIAGTDASSVLPGDFILPIEKPMYSPLTVDIISLDLNPSYASSIEDKGINHSLTNKALELQNFSSSVRFLVKSAEESERELKIKLTYDVLFVTAHPCIPPTNFDVLQSPTNPSFQKSAAKSTKYDMIRRGHPLYKAFTYTKVPLSYITSTPARTRFSTILSQPTSPDPFQSSLHTTSSSIPKVLVIDCTEPQSNSETCARNNGNSDRETLARAICAERRWNALISRQDKVCLACSVREASALGWRVIIRLA